MMDFYARESAIISKVKTDFNTWLTAHDLEALPEEAFINDYLDLDKYRQNLCLFFGFDNYTIGDLSNESQDLTIRLNVYVCARNNKATRETVLNYTSAFINWFYASGRNFSGLVDTGNASTVTYYDAAEGNLNIKISSIAFELYKEE